MKFKFRGIKEQRLGIQTWLSAPENDPLSFLLNVLLVSGVIGSIIGDAPYSFTRVHIIITMDWKLKKLINCAEH